MPPAPIPLSPPLQDEVAEVAARDRRWEPMGSTKRSVEGASAGWSRSDASGTNPSLSAIASPSPLCFLDALRLLMAGHMEIILDNLNDRENLSGVECPEPVDGLFWVYIVQCSNRTLYVGHTGAFLGAFLGTCIFRDRHFTSSLHGTSLHSICCSEESIFWPLSTAYENRQWPIRCCGLD